MKRDILSSAEDITERVASGVLWVPVFFGFVLDVAALATRPGWHVLLFPPLVVMAYEMVCAFNILSLGATLLVFNPRLYAFGNQW